MAVFKRAKCTSCGKMRNEAKPDKTPADCPKCGHRMRYLENWYISYQLHGKKNVEAVAPQKRLTEDALAKIKIEIREGKYFKRTNTPNHTLKELSEDYLKWAEKQKAFRSKKGFIKRLLVAFGKYPLKAFNTKMIEEYQSKLLSDGKAPATANRHLATLKHMFSKAVEWEMISEDVLMKVRKAKLLPEDNRRLRFLSGEECQTLVDACVPHIRPIVITAMNTGMRREEIFSLEWERHVDLKHGFILLYVTKNGERREVPINRTLRETLLSIPRHVRSPYVFTDKLGNRFVDIKRSFRTACNRAGIKDFRFHDLRHTFASLLVMGGVDITTVKELLGHKTLTMTLRYAHLAPSHKIKAVGVLDDIGTAKKEPERVTNMLPL